MNIAILVMRKNVDIEHKTQFLVKSEKYKLSVVDVNLSNNKTVSWDLNEILSMVNHLKSDNTFKFGLGVFFMGVIIQLAGMLVKYK
jgi:hypothetical protein